MLARSKRWLVVPVALAVVAVASCTSRSPPDAGDAGQITDMGADDVQSDTLDENCTVLTEADGAPFQTVCRLDGGCYLVIDLDGGTRTVC